MSQLQNPFSQQKLSAAHVRSNNPRGQSFSVKSGEDVFVGRAVNGPWVKHTITKFLEIAAKSIAAGVAEELNAKNASLLARIEFLESELGISQGTAFKSKRRSVDD